MDILAALEVFFHSISSALEFSRILDFDLRTNWLSSRLFRELSSLWLGPDWRRGWSLVDFLALIVLGVGLLLLAVLGVSAGEEFRPLGLKPLHLFLGLSRPFPKDLLVPGVMLLLELEVVDGVLAD